MNQASKPLLRQGLKPMLFERLDGTAEAMPFQNDL